MFDKAFYTARWLNMMKNSVSQPAAKSGFVDDLKREIRKGGWAATYLQILANCGGRKIKTMLVYKQRRTSFNG